MKSTPRQNFPSGTQQTEVIQKDMEMMRHRLQYKKRDYQQLITSTRKSVEDTRELLQEIEERTRRLKQP